MKKLYAALFFSCLSAASYAQDVIPNLSPMTKKYIKDYKERKLADDAELFVYKKIGGKDYVSTIIKVANAAVVQSKLANMGVLVGTKAGDIWTAQVPVDKVIEFTTVAGIAYIQVDEPVFPDLEQARKTTRTDSVHGGYNLPIRYSGKGVVMGVMDFGFDYNHPTMYDTTGTRYRVKKVWQMNGTSAPPAGFAYGKEIADTNAIRAEGTDDPNQTHGTAVAGMAAGSGFGSTSTSNAKFRGMAYDADMVFVCVRRDSIGKQWMQSGFSDFLDGVNYIFTYANSVGKPAVVNISWGSQSGPHDGTSLFAQACNNMTGPGKIIVMSAGNDGATRLHLAKTFTATDTMISTFLYFSSLAYQRTWVDVWGEPGNTFCASATLYHNGVAGATTNFVCIDGQIHDMFLLGSNPNDTCTVQFITSASEFNGKPRTIVNIFNKTTDSVGVSVKSTSGKIDMWDESYYYGFPYRYDSWFDNFGKTWAANGDVATTVSDMGSAQSVLLVGAYASKVSFVDINNNSWSYSGYVANGNLVPFSSRGPMVDGRVKPDITAPGITIATSMSSYDTAYTPTGSNSDLTISKYHNPVSNKDFYYAEFSGTSASAPAASGIVALLLQAHSLFQPHEIKDILAASAIKDVYTGTLPAGGNNNWGKGKINAYGAMKLAIVKAGVYNFSGKKLDCVLYPNPNNGSFTLEYTAEKTEHVSVEVSNITGSSVAAQSWDVQTGSNLKQLDLSGLPKGAYFVKLRSADGVVVIKTVME